MNLFEKAKKANKEFDKKENYFKLISLLEKFIIDAANKGNTYFLFNEDTYLYSLWITNIPKICIYLRKQGFEIVTNEWFLPHKRWVKIIWG